MSSEIRSLTGIRGVAAVWVMLGHYLGESPANETVRFVVGRGYVAVDVFMVLSGFVLALTYQARFEQTGARGAFGRFLWQRLARIYPLYALTTLVCVALAWAGLPVWGVTALSANLVTANLAMVQVWLPSLASLNATGWSISAEWAANLLFPVFVLLLSRWPSVRASVTLGLACAALTVAAFTQGNAGEGDYAAGALDWYIYPHALTRCIPEFVLGMVCWQLRRFAPWTSILGRTPVLLTLLILSAGLTVFTMLDLVLVVLVCGLVIGLSYEQSAIATALGSAVPRFLGGISFGIYMIQMPVLSLRPMLEAALARIGVPAPDDVATALVLAIVVGLSALSLAWFERPVQQWLRRLNARPAARRAAATVLFTALVLEANPMTTAKAEEVQAPWWRERHEARRDLARRGGIDLVLMGDSITHNYEIEGPEPWHDFRPVWARFYAHRRALNLGFSGDTTANLLWRLRNGELDGIAPAAVVILIGINDIARGATAEETVAGIGAVVDEVRGRLPAAGIVVVGVLPSGYGEKMTGTARAVNAALAGRYGGGRMAAVAYIDVSALFERDGKADPSLYYDPRLTPPEPPLHPTPEGQARMAEAIEPVLAGFLSGRSPVR